MPVESHTLQPDELRMLECPALQLGELRMLEVTSPSNTAPRICEPPEFTARTIEVALAGPYAGRDSPRQPANGAGEAYTALCSMSDAAAPGDGITHVPYTCAARAPNGAECANTSDGASEGHFLLALQLEGTSVHYESDREAKLSPGDFTLCSSTRSSRVDLAPDSRYLVISIPDPLMRRHLPSPDDVVAVRMSGSRGLTAVLSNFIKTFWTCRTDVVDPAVALRMSYTLLDLIAAAYSVSPHARHEASSLVAAHRVRIIDYIESHLRDPNLNPTTVARACKITARYLHHLFTAESETVTQYIQRRRLEECARALIATPIRTRLVTEIAFDYGFNSLTHFGRVFRHQFGQTPSEYRRSAHDPIAPSPLTAEKVNPPSPTTGAMTNKVNPPSSTRSAGTSAKGSSRGLVQ